MLVIDHTVDKKGKPIIKISDKDGMKNEMNLPEAYEFLKDYEEENGELNFREDEEYECGYIYCSVDDDDDESGSESDD